MKPPHLRHARKNERGFALLLVFAMAATIAIMLYMEAPRIVFEGQRNKEQLLIERGEQYKRAIQVFYRKNKKLPQRVEELEEFQDIHFLRRKYKDPFSGKDDWKLLQADASGQITNSLVQKQKNQLSKDDKDKKDGAASTDPNSAQQFGQFGMPGIPGQPPQPGEVNAGLQRRASDRPATAAGGGGGEPQGLPACDPALPVDPARCDPSKQWDPNQQQLQQQQPNPPGAPGDPQAQYQFQPGTQQQPGLQQQPGFPQQQQLGVPGQSPYPGQPIPGFPLSPGQQFPMPGGLPRPGGLPYNPNQQQPGSNPYYAPAPAANSQTGGMVPQPATGIGGGVGAPGTQPGNAALGMIQSILSQPRPGGMPGQQAGGAMGPGIVGVATKHEGVGIKVYAERSKYQEWEFIYDPKKEKAPNTSGNLQGGTGTDGQGNNNNNNRQGGMGGGMGTGGAFGSQQGGGMTRPPR